MRGHFLSRPLSSMFCVDTVSDDASCRCILLVFMFVYGSGSSSRS